MAENEYVLKQRTTTGLELQVKLVDGRKLQVLIKGKKSSQDFSVDILSLQDKSKKIFFVAWKWLISSIGFFLVTMVLLKILPDYLNADKNLYLGIILIIGLIGGIVFFVKFLKHTSIKQVFYSRNARVPIIMLRIGKPSKKTFSTFINAIEKRIARFRNHMDIADEKQLTGEIKMLRRLSDSGVISKRDYKRAKSKLFSGFDRPVITRGR